MTLYPWLTLTLGLRYEIQLPRTTRYNRQNWFDFGIRNPISDDVGMDLRGGLVFASPSERGQTELDHWNMAPRIGFAYKVTDRRVMRGGYGISYMRSNGRVPSSPQRTAPPRATRSRRCCSVPAQAATYRIPWRR